MNSKIKSMLISGICVSILFGGILKLSSSAAYEQSHMKDIKKKIIGTWITEYNFPSVHGFNIRTFSPDMICKTKRAVYFKDNRKIIETEESYDFEGDKIKYTMTKSDNPDLMRIGSTTQDNILTATNNEMWYSDHSGARYVYKKINPLQAQLLWKTRLVSTADAQVKVQRQFYPSTSKVYSETYFDDRGREVMSKNYYKNGKLKSELKVSGENEKTTRTFSENGALIFEGIFKNDYSEGSEKSYYRDGRLSQEKVIKNGMVYSEKMYDQYGALMSETLQNEQKNYDDGVLILHTTMDSNKNGAIIKKGFYQDGSIKSTEECDRSQKNGILTCYYKSGQISAEVIKKDGAIIRIKGYDKNGGTIFDKSMDDIKREEAEYVSGKNKGVFVEYLFNGYLMKTTYDNGQITKKAHYNENGDLAIDEDLERGSSKQYRDDGTIRMEFIEKSAPGLGPKKPIGSTGSSDVISYYRNGVTKEIRSFREGRIAHLKEFDEKGKVVLEKDAKDGSIEMF